MNKCDFCIISVNKNGKLICPRREGRDYTFCNDAIEKLERSCKENKNDATLA